MKMFWKGRNEGIFGNPIWIKYEIAVTRKAMGQIESVSEDWDLKMLMKELFSL